MHKHKKNKVFYYILFSVLVILIIILSIFIYKNLTKSSEWDKPYSKEMYDKIINFIGKENLKDANLKSIENREYLPKEMFINIPNRPAGFYKVIDDIRSNKITDLCSLEKEYYIQPEFFPSFKESLKIIQNPPEERWSPFGYGYYPGQSAVISYAGECFSLCYFFTSGALVETWQPIKLSYDFPEKMQIKKNYMLDNLTIIRQNSTLVKDYFTVNITPEQFLLPSNYPVYDKDATKRVDVNICLSQNTSKGYYAVNINKVDADEDFILSEKDKIDGIVTDNIFSLQNPHITIFVKVE